MSSSSFDHDLKFGRAFEHLQQLKAAEDRWLNGDHHSLRQERDPKTWDVTLFATVTEQPPADPFGLLIGDCLHNLRSALDLLAYALAGPKPLPQDIAEASEFPIFGDESRSGKSGVGPDLFRDHGLAKIASWDPKAKTVIEGLQPYKRGNAYRTHPLWILHELDRVNKHRLLHTAVAAFEGFYMEPSKNVNVASFGPGAIESLGGTVETDTPVAIVPHVTAIDSEQDVHMEIAPALRIAFAKGTPSVADEPVLNTLYDLYFYVDGTVFDALRPFL